MIPAKRTTVCRSQIAEVVPAGLKPTPNPGDLRGPFGRLRAGSEGPLFYGDADAIESFPGRYGS